MKGNEETIDGGTAVAKRPSLVTRLAARLGGSASASSVYGEPVVREGVTVIPVAKVAYAFGGGGGDGVQGTGEGGGGAVSARPAGYIEIRDGETTFRRIFDPLSLVPLVLAGGVAGVMVLRGLRQVLQRDRDDA